MCIGGKYLQTKLQILKLLLLKYCSWAHISGISNLLEYNLILQFSLKCQFLLAQSNILHFLLHYIYLSDLVTVNFQIYDKK